MAKRRIQSARMLRVLRQQITGNRTKEDPSVATGSSQASLLAEEADFGAVDPMGSCRYADGLGQMQCESPVAKSYCDARSGFFTPDGRC